MDVNEFRLHKYIPNSLGISARPSNFSGFRIHKHKLKFFLHLTKIKEIKLRNRKI